MLTHHKLLPPPERVEGIPESAKWLSGEGAGSWFVIEPYEGGDAMFKASRYAPSGYLECRGVFRANAGFDPSQDFHLQFPAHCAKITVVQRNAVVALCRIHGNTASEV